ALQSAYEDTLPPSLSKFTSTRIARVCARVKPTDLAGWLRRNRSYGRGFVPQRTGAKSASEGATISLPDSGDRARQSSAATRL
ncbi:MAG TPA: hypothetical protein VF856_11070, partial [Gemmatimonadaceae bacterium]